MNLNIHDVRSSEITKRREDNVRAMEQKQQQVELESFRRSEAIEAARREKLRKQRNAERLLRESHEAAERSEQERMRVEHALMEKQRQEQLDAERKRIEQVRKEERERQLARAKQLKEAEEAAAKAKADEARRQQERLEATAGERMKKSFDRILQRLHDTIAADNKMMESDAAARRRERQVASDAHLALGRVKAIERQLCVHREHERTRLDDLRKRNEAEDLDQRFYLTELSPEQARSVLLIPRAIAGSAAAKGAEGGEAAGERERSPGSEDEEEDDEGELDGAFNAVAADDDDEQDGGSSQLQQQQRLAAKQRRKNLRQQRALGEQQKNAQQAVASSSTEQQQPDASQARRRSLGPLDYKTWEKQRESEAELVSLSLEYKMRTGVGAKC
jgi:hypothetical protein